MKNSILLFLLLGISATVFGQKYPYDFPVDTTISGSENVHWQNKSGATYTSYNLPFPYVKKYMSPNVVTSAVSFNPATATTGQKYNYLGKFVTYTTNSHVYYIDGVGNVMDLGDPAGGGGGSDSTAVLRTDINNLQVLTGRVDGSTHLGTFTGSTISDNVAIKPALQSLETSVETKLTDGAGVVGPTQIASTAVTPASYTLVNATIDADGRITAASNGGGGLTTGNVTYVLKTGNDGTAQRGNPAKPYLTIAAAVTAANVGDVIEIGYGVFSENGITLKNGLEIRGRGDSTIWKATAVSQTLLSAGGTDKWKVSNIHFIGTNSTTVIDSTSIRDSAQTAILITGQADEWVIEKCTFENFKGSGIRGSNTSGQQVSLVAGKVLACIFKQNKIGLKIGEYLEYVQIQNCIFNGNVTGSYDIGGNARYDNCTWEGDYFGLWLANGNNNSHGSASNCAFNHCLRYGIMTISITNGFEITGGHINQNPVYLLSSSSVHFANNLASNVAITVDGGSKNAWIGGNDYGTPPTFTYLNSGVLTINQQQGVIETNSTLTGTLVVAAHYAPSANYAILNVGKSSTRNFQAYWDEASSKAIMATAGNSFPIDFPVICNFTQNPTITKASPALNFVPSSSATHGQINVVTASSDLFFSFVGTEKMRLKASGNLGLGTSSPVASALFDMTSTTQGFLQPRMTITQRNAISSPATGLQVYQTTTNKPSWYNGTSWHVPADSTDINDGVWTPTLTGVSNVAASTAYECQYSRVGSTVTFSGLVDIDPTTTGITQLGISLPIASNFTALEKAGGTGVALDNTAFGIKADATNDRLNVTFTAVSTSNTQFTFSGSYRVQ